MAQVTQTRLPIGGIFVKNASFEQQPTFTAVQTATNWLDGSAAGSATNDQYGWYFAAVANNASAQYDSSTANFGTGSLKLSTTNAAGRARMLLIPAVNYGSIAAANLKYLLPCTPSKTYTLTCYAKCTTAVTNGVSVGFGSTTGAGATPSLTLSNRLSGTVATWTLLTATIASGASDNFLCIQLNNDTAGNVSDAWFDDIQIVQSGVTRISVV